jgi:hypothetical protein
MERRAPPAVFALEIVNPVASQCLAASPTAREEGGH